MTLYPFQEEGSRWLAERNRAYLADFMGCGKTVQACDAARRVGAKSVLVICPASATENWRREWKEWGTQGVPFAPRSFDYVRRNDRIMGQWDLVIIDEAHYCKSRNAKRTIAALDVARKSRRVWLLSATPMPNHPGELWAPLRALWPEIPKALGLNSHQQWMQHFCRFVDTKFGPKVYGSKNTDDLKPYLKQIMLRRTIEEVGLQLPPLRVDVSLLPKDPGINEDDDMHRALAAMEREEALGDDAQMARLRRTLGEFKAPAIADILAEELRERQYPKIVVLAYHHSVLDVLRKKLSPFGVMGFDGSTPAQSRQFAIDVFRDDPSIRVFVAQQTAAGIAVNLQVASEIVLVEPSWSPDEDAQAISRIHRIGSTHPCRARIFAVAGTLDEAMQRVRASKIKMQVSLGLRDGKDAAQ